MSNPISACFVKLGRDTKGLNGYFILLVYIIIPLMGSSFTLASEAGQKAAVTQWQGRSTAVLVDVSEEQVWPLLSTYCDIYRWLPTVQDSYCVSVITTPVTLSGCCLHPGVIRNCTSSNLLSLTPPPSPPNKMDTWVLEKLIAINCDEKWFSFEIVDSNVGIDNYVATVKVIDYGGKDHNSGAGGRGMTTACGCAVEYSYKVDPIEGTTEEGFFSFVDSFVHIMAERLRSAINSW